MPRLQFLINVSEAGRGIDCFKWPRNTCINLLNLPLGERRFLRLPSNSEPSEMHTCSSSSLEMGEEEDTGSTVRQVGVRGSSRTTHTQSQVSQAPDKPSLLQHQVGRKEPRGATKEGWSREKGNSIQFAEAKEYPLCLFF